MLDENLSCRDHIYKIETKITKHFGFSYKVLKYLCFVLCRVILQGYLNYANTAWGSTHKTKSINLSRRQKLGC